MNSQPSHPTGSNDFDHSGAIDAAMGEHRYLIFYIAEQAFAAPLLSIREIVEPLPYRSVPNRHDFFLGLANLRGQVVGVLDLGRRFGLADVASSGGGVFLIFDVEGTAMAGFVNRVASVTFVPPSAIFDDCHMVTEIPGLTLKNIAKIANNLVPVVNLADLLRDQLQSVG